MVYRIFFKGKDKQSLSLHGLSVPANTVMYVDEVDLPCSVREAKKHVDIVKCDDVPEDAIALAKETAKLSGKTGIVWVGTVSRKITEPGEFQKDEPRFDLSDVVVKDLATKSGFKKIGA